MHHAGSPREGEKRLHAAVEAASIGFALVDLDGRVRAVNQAFCEMLGYSEAELFAMRYEDLIHPDDRSVDDALRLRVLAGEVGDNHSERRLYHKDGHVVWARLAMSLVRTSSGVEYFVSQVCGITPQMAAEQAAGHAAELERSNEGLQEFAALASHDLQEPLRIVGSYAQLLAEQYGERFDEAGARWLNYIVAGVERMHRLIDDMLALARVRSDGNVFGETNVSRIVAATWAELQKQFAGVDATLTIDVLPLVDADAAQIMMLVRNLLLNALKNRRTDVPLEIRVSADHMAAEHGEPAMLGLSVADNGIGLDMRHAGRIFEIFYRVHREDEYEGTGVGLAICRRIVERHGGRIWVESPPNQGATFRFTLRERPPPPV
jgi:PAS domain S-box-containing protein